MCTLCEVRAVISCTDDCDCQSCQILHRYLKVQSEDVIREDFEETTSDQINVGFSDTKTGEKVMKTEAPSWYQPTTQKETDLNEYLRRPVEILTDTWAVGASKTISDSFQPWHLFFNHTSIKKKIDNYAFIRCDLHLKIMINASPFYYGSLCFSYQPMSGSFNSAPIASLSPWTIPLSQRPSVWIYPQDGESKEITLPYLSHTEWLTLGSATELQNFGKVTYFSPQTLSNCNGATSDISIHVYAWAENVVLSGLTVDLAVQSKDEYVTEGAISRPASAIARATGLLSSIPVIGPYMTATSVAANKVADVAKLFGYSKVPVVEDTKPYKNLPFHGLAVSDISDATEKLTVDSKNELTINNRCIGDPMADNLLVSHWVQRNSYFQNFTWQATDAAGTLLYNFYVHPLVGRGTVSTYQTTTNFAPVAIPALSHSYWRGDMIYDFKIVCSRYHKGRLRFSWDPVGDIANTANSLTEVYTQIVDISEQTFVSIRVPYNQRVAYLKTPSSLSTTVGSVSPLAKDSSDTINGILTVRVLNEQTSPIDSADISINVFIRGADNLEFAAPKEISQDIAFYTVQAEDETLTMGELSNTDPNLNLVYMGEKISSLRELLMRSNLSISYSFLEDANGERLETIVMNRRPLYNGFDTNGIHNAVSIASVGDKLYNFVKTTPYHLISSCFLGERGSFTWKFNYNGFQPSSAYVERDHTVLNKSNYLPVESAYLSNNNGTTANIFNTTIKTNAGSLLINERTNTGISFNAPMYSQYTCLDTSPATRTEGLVNVSGSDSIRSHYIDKNYKQRGTDYYVSNFYFNVGTDYSLYFFLNVPSYYIYVSTPVPSTDP